MRLGVLGNLAPFKLIHRSTDSTRAVGRSSVILPLYKPQEDKPLEQQEAGKAFDWRIWGSRSVVIG